MREILFRGERTDNGEWVEGYYLNQRESLTDKKACYIADNNGYGFNYISVIPETVCQFTGLYDKNGRKIFEGDILRCVDEYETYITSVYYAENTLCVDIHIGVDIPECDNYTAIGFAESIWKNQCCEVEVIGNIYDNQELLKGGVENG